MDAGRRAARASVGKWLRFLGLLCSSSANYRLGVNAATLLTILTILRIARAVAC